MGFYPGSDTKYKTQGNNFSGLQLLVCQVDMSLPQGTGSRIKELMCLLRSVPGAE